MNIFKISVAAALAVSTVSAPVMAQSAAPLSVAGSVRSGAAMSGSSNLDRLSMMGIGLIALMAAIIVLSNSGGDNDLGNPNSP